MIKGVLKGGPTDLLLLGLSRENINRLIAGDPILIVPAQLWEIGVTLKMPIVIHFGETEQDILDETRARGVDLKTAQHDHS